MKERAWLPEAVARAVAHARSRGALYAIETAATIVRDHDISFVVRIVASLQHKPTSEPPDGPNEVMASTTTTTTTITDNDTSSTSGQDTTAISALDLAEKAATSHLEMRDIPDPFLPYEEDLYVGDVPPAHVCLLNKFNVVDGHLLIVTRSFQEQTLLLTNADFSAFWHCIRQYPGLGFYNSGRIAGASQRHKHMQLIALTAETEIPIHEHVSKAARVREEQDGCFTVPSLPFKHAVIGTSDLRSDKESDSVIGAILQSRYMQLLQFTIDRLSVSASSWIAWESSTSRASTSFGNEHETAHPFPYNLLLTSSWMMLVPRQQEKFLNEISVNALGFAGFLLAKNEAQRNLIVQRGPLNVLRQVGIPWDQ